MGKKVRVIVDPRTGEMKIEVNGVSGGGCRDLTRGLEERVGTVKSREDTPEAFETETIERYLEQPEN